MSKTYLYAKKIHRLLIVAIVTLGLVMSFTGLAIGNGYFVKIFGFEFMTLSRRIHSVTSTYFVIVLFLMSVTGLLLYFIPNISRKKRIDAE